MDFITTFNDDFKSLNDLLLPDEIFKQETGTKVKLDVNENKGKSVWEYAKPNGKLNPTFKCVDDFSLKLMHPTYDLASSSIAIWENDEIVYEQGYGMRDVPGVLSTNNTELVYPDETTYRFGSNTKVILTLTVFKLIEMGKLSLESKVFGDGGLLEHLTKTPLSCCPISDERMYDITVLHLLQHSGGWNRTSAGEIGLEYFSNFKPDLVEKLQIDTNKTTISNLDRVRYHLSLPLQFSPGTGSEYSNLGFGILELVIENVTDMTYREAVTKYIFDPAGINSTKLYFGRQLARDSPKHEAEYYSDGVPPLLPSIIPGDTRMLTLPYTLLNVEESDGVGGIVSTPREMLKIFTKIKTPHCNITSEGSKLRNPCLLQQETVDLMFQTSGFSEFYATGIMTGGNIKNFNVGEWYGHGGSLPGANSGVVLFENGIGISYVTSGQSVSTFGAAIQMATVCVYGALNKTLSPTQSPIALPTSSPIASPTSSPSGTPTLSPTDFTPTGSPVASGSYLIDPIFSIFLAMFLFFTFRKV